MTPLLEAMNRIDNDSLFEAYDQAHGPFCVSKEGRPDLIIMAASDFEDPSRALASSDAASLEEGYAQALRGETVNAHDALDRISARYGL